MAAKRVFQSIMVIALLAASLAWTGSAFAWSGCSGYVTVNWGDSLSGMAAACGTTVDAIRAANPGMGWQLYAGQVIYMPTGYSSAGYYPPQSGGSTYVVRWGDALGDIAVRYGVSLASLLAVNPQIWNPSLIFPGQVINLPASGNYQPSNNYPPTYYPPSYYPPTYYPPAYYPPTSYPPPPVSSDFSVLKVTFGHGLLVRTGPGKNFSEIKSPFVSADKNSTWRYRKSSITVDSTGLVWVEVQLSQPVNGSSTGWIMVKDMFGSYFTDPNINR